MNLFSILAATQSKNNVLLERRVAQMKKEISARNVQSEYIANLYFICEKLINLVTSRNVEMGVCKLLIIL